MNPNASSNSTVIEFENFTFKYDSLDENTLFNINLNIKAGEKVLITGKSGSGKSTLAHCINGLIPFTYKGEYTGSVKVLDSVPRDLSLFDMGGKVGTIMQDQDCQFVALSAGEDVAFAFENDCLPTDEMKDKVLEALGQVDMKDFIGQPPQSLSGGQKQKVAIAGILAMDVPILLFDEPLANLDPASGVKAMEIINEIHLRGGKTIVVIEHRIEDVLEHGFDRVIIVDEGRIVADGSPDEILASGVLIKNGLRQPLYVEMLQLSGVKATAEDKISDLKNTLKFKETVLNSYEKENFCSEVKFPKEILRVEGVSYKYYKEDPYIIENISFKVGEGEIVAVVGNNGAGKSTLLKAISGIAKYQEGSIYCRGVCIDGMTAKNRASSIGFVMQNPNHMITKNLIFDEVAFGSRNLGMPEEKVETLVNECLRICGLYPYRKWPVGALSYGQKKRVTIASVLAMGPRVIILDEPTAGQDYTSYKEFMGYLKEVAATGVGIILITHDMHLALEYADRGVVLSGGRVIADDTMDKILSDGDLIDRANLKHTSIEKMGRLYEVEDLSNFIKYFTCRVTGGGHYE